MLYPEGFGEAIRELRENTSLNALRRGLKRAGKTRRGTAGFCRC